MLEDLWKGWKGYREDRVIYSYRKGFKAKTVKVPGEEVLKAFSRVKGLPKNFIRIRWFGWLGNNKKGEVLKGLGFEQKEAKELAQEAGWEKVGLYEVRSFGKEAWVFKKVDSAGRGEEVLKVPLSQLCFSPSDVVGRRRCWMPPPDLGNLVLALRNGAKIVSGFP